MQQPGDNVTEFRSVDQAPDPPFFPKFMNRSHQLETASAYKQRIIDELALREGAAVLDVGCGAGQDTLDLARIVGDHGRVVGIDSSETMLQEARTHATEARLSAEYRVADATALPFTDDSFDGCRASRIFGYVKEPERALAEMVRVARPGARIVLAEGDFDLLAIELPDRVLAREITHAICDQMEQGWIGRQLPRLFRQAGLSNIRVEGWVMQIDYPFFRLAFSGMLQQVRDTSSGCSSIKKWSPIPGSSHLRISLKSRSTYSLGARSIVCLVKVTPVGTTILSSGCRTLG